TAEAQLSFVNRSFAPGFNLMANPLQTGSNTLNEVLPLVPPGTRLYKFNNGAQAYEPVETFVQNVGWVPGGLALSPGEGAYLHAPTQFVATFVGFAQHDRSWPSVPTNSCYLFSSRTPQSGSFSTLFFPPPPNAGVVYL